MKAMFALLAGIVTLNGAAAHAQAPQAVIDLIQNTYSPKISVTETDATQFLDLCRKTTVVITAQDPVTLAPGKAQVMMYVRKGTNDPGDQKTVILLPPTGGENPLDRSYAEALCVAGVRVALVESWDNDTKAELDMDMHDRGALRALSTVRHTIEYLKPRRKTQLGILGTSVGAITAAMVLGYDSRIGTAALIVGGGGMAEIISSSSEKTLTQLREARMKAFGLKTIEEYEQALRAHIHIEPLELIASAPRKQVWMMVALKDITVPTKNQFDLYKALGSQDLLTHDDDHFGTIVFTSLLHTLTIVDYLTSHLN